MARQEAMINTVFYRSLQECPSVKAIYLDAVSYLYCTQKEPSPSNSSLQKILDILIEKEGRVRLPLEELEILLEQEEDEDADE